MIERSNNHITIYESNRFTHNVNHYHYRFPLPPGITHNSSEIGLSRPAHLLARPSLVLGQSLNSPISKSPIQPSRNHEHRMI